MTKVSPGAASSGEGAAAPIIEARRVEPGGGVRPALDDFTYTVLLGPAPAASERRTNQRRRTRLRSGKIVDTEGRFVTECLVHDLSATGGRLRLPAGLALPARIHFYDDLTGELQPASVLWRRDGEAGVVFKLQAETPHGRRIADAMRRKFYAVRG